MLPGPHRLTRRRDFAAVYRSGRRLGSRTLTLRVTRRREAGPTRFGFVVGTKVSKAATVRNRIKRQLRHLVRARLPNIPPSLDAVLSYHGGPNVTGPELEQALDYALRNLPKP